LEPTEPSLSQRSRLDQQHVDAVKLENKDQDKVLYLYQVVQTPGVRTPPLFLELLVLFLK
jgi:hypothetical protein